MLNYIKNLVSSKYATHPEAIVISCFFNPMKSPYRLKAFKAFHQSIKHMNHKIVECVIGNDGRQLDWSENISVVQTESLLWHKEALLNGIIKSLPKHYKYIFWVDADVLFTNKYWLTQGVEQLKKVNIIQPFEYCVHLNRDEIKPSFEFSEYLRDVIWHPNLRNPSTWRSFCANYVDYPDRARQLDYNWHGHVGFAWGARRDVLDRVPLYDKGLIGGADHIMAHAAANQIPHNCIDKSFTDNLKHVYDWSRSFAHVVEGKIGYVKGDLYHLWHGDIDKRQYLKRIQDFTVRTKKITEKDKFGLYYTKDKEDAAYMERYFKNREVPRNTPKTASKTIKLAPEKKGKAYPKPRTLVRQSLRTVVHEPAPIDFIQDDFLNSVLIGYASDSTLIGGAVGGNYFGAAIGEALRDDEPQQEQEVIEQQPENNLPSEEVLLENPEASTGSSSNENFS